eukprot:1807751-Rhodomonas_salina.1
MWYKLYPHALLFIPGTPGTGSSTDPFRPTAAAPEEGFYNINVIMIVPRKIFCPLLTGNSLTPVSLTRRYPGRAISPLIATTAE